jgi:hypothetical protein
MKYGNQNIGGFFVIELLTNRIIKEHKHMNTALTHWRKLGKEGYVVKPVPDRLAFYAQLTAMGHNVPNNFSQTS